MAFLTEGFEIPVVFLDANALTILRIALMRAKAVD